MCFDGTLESVPEVEILVGRGLGLVPEKRELFSSMSVEDNLKLGGFMRYRKGDRYQDSSLMEIYSLFPDCWSVASRQPQRFREANGRCLPSAAR